jgi:hypothetical protein
MWFLSFLIGSVGRWLLIGAAAAAILAGAYIWGRMDCTAAANVRQYQATVDSLRRIIERREAKRLADDAQAIEDRAILDEAREDNRKLEHDLKELTGSCLPDDVVDRMRRGWRR